MIGRLLHFAISCMTSGVNDPPAPLSPNSMLGLTYGRYSLIVSIDLLVSDFFSCMRAGKVLISYHISYFLYGFKKGQPISNIGTCKRLLRRSKASTRCADETFHIHQPELSICLLYFFFNKTLQIQTGKTYECGGVVVGGECMVQWGGV